MIKDIKQLIRKDETYESIRLGKCICGEPYALITGSNKTFYKDGRRYARVNCDEIGWSSFRCKNCKEVLENTWIENND